jgi:transposase
VEKTKSRAEKQPRQGRSEHALERTLAQIELRLGRTEKKVTYLEKKVKKVEAERDEFKALYAKAVGTIRERDKQIVALTVKIDSAEKQLAWLRNEVFGQSSEADSGREPAGAGTADDETTKKKRGQQAGKAGHGRTKRPGLNEKDVHLDVQDSCCLTCSKPFKLLPGTDDSSILEIAILLTKLNVHCRRYARQCNCPGPKIVTAAPLPKLYPRTNIGNSLWVHLCVQKFLHGTPTNRILKDLALRGLGLAAGTVTGGMKVINDLLQPLYEEIKIFCQGEKYWNADETSWRVFNDKSGKKKSNKWWLWVIAGRQAVVYILDKSRSRRVPSEFFAGSSGVLVTDRYAVYKSLGHSIRKAWCWVHVRRDFLKFLPLAKFSSWAKEWLHHIGMLFALNEKRFRLWADNNDSGPQWKQACLELNTHVDFLQSQWNAQLLSPLNKEQRTAVLSLKRHWDGLTLFLQDPRIPLHNNRAERLLRPCVINRKNSYGSGAEWAGALSAKFFSIFQTWLINGLDPQALLLDYFNQCSLNPGHPPPSVDNFLPWKMHEQRKTEFRLPCSYKRPA